MKEVFWIIGANGVGKTTLAYNIHHFLSSSLGETINPQSDSFNYVDCRDGAYFTRMTENSINLGKWTGKACCGTDTLSTKDQIKRSFEASLRQVEQFVVVDGIMATGTWIDFIKTEDTRVILVYLDADLDLVEKRVLRRRSIKKGISVADLEISVKTRENLLTKVKGFASLYKRMEGKVDLAISLDSAQPQCSHLSKIFSAYFKTFSVF